MRSVVDEKGSITLHHRSILLLLLRRYGHAVQQDGKRPHSLQGLTLIEVLIVMVILGILGAIASPSFLSQTTRARESEAKVNVGAMLKAQQVHYLEYSSFATNLEDLSLGISSETKHYKYRTHLSSNHEDANNNDIAELATAIALPQTNVRGYMGKAWLDAFHGAATIKTVLCEGGLNESYFMDGKTYCK